MIHTSTYKVKPVGNTLSGKSIKINSGKSIILKGADDKAEENVELIAKEIILAHTNISAGIAVILKTEELKCIGSTISAPDIYLPKYADICHIDCQFIGNLHYEIEDTQDYLVEEITA